jgi:hypothetical protein
MFKWFNNALRPKLQKLKSGSRVIAHDFDIDDWKPSRVEYVKRRRMARTTPNRARCIFGKLGNADSELIRRIGK